MRPCATGLSPKAACRVFAGNAMSSQYRAVPLTCSGALSWVCELPVGMLVHVPQCIGRAQASARRLLLPKKAAQQIAGGAQAIGARGAQIRQGFEIGRERADG